MRHGRLGSPSALSDNARWHQFDTASEIVSPGGRETSPRLVILLHEHLRSTSIFGGSASVLPDLPRHSA